jgi:DNA-binding transcriptional MerR regulator
MDYTPFDRMKKMNKISPKVKRRRIRMEATFSISEISKLTGLSYDTIRYYEKIGLLKSEKRKISGRRKYNKLDLEYLIFITHLKRTNMTLKEIDVLMIKVSAENYANCYSILCNHKLKIESQIEEMNATLGVINNKIKHFKNLIKNDND